MQRWTCLLALGLVGPLSSCAVLASGMKDPATQPQATTSDVRLVTEIGLQAADLTDGPVDGLVVDTLKSGYDYQGVPTLDQCGASYPSETLRTARRQVRVKVAQGTYYSSEVVAYQDTAAAAQAMAELRKATKTCPKGFVKVPGAAEKQVLRTRIVRSGTDQATLPVTPSLLVFQRRDVRGEAPVFVIAAYQQRGNVLDAHEILSSAPTTEEQRVELLRQATLTGQRLADRFPEPT